MFQWVRVWELLRRAVLAPESLKVAVYDESFIVWRLQRGLKDHLRVGHSYSCQVWRLTMVVTGWFGGWSLDVFPCWASWWCDSYLPLEWVIWDDGGNCNVFYGLNLKVMLQSALKAVWEESDPGAWIPEAESLGSHLEASTAIKMIQLLVGHPVQTICLLGVSWPG